MFVLNVEPRKMSLSKDTAARIVTAVVNGPESRRRIDSTWGQLFPAALGMAGSVRNLVFIAQDADPTEPDVAQYACTGIADSTSADINQAQIAEVKNATRIDRTLHRTAHTATLVQLQDASEYVFNWHQTLRTDNPLIFAASDWPTNINGVPLKDFQGL
jgi:hypothetical protein